MKPWWTTGNPDEPRNEPWLHPAIVAYIEMWLQPDWHVLEHGSGGSTRWFSERVKKTTCVERDPTWKEAVIRVTDHEKVNFYDGSAQSLSEAMPHKYDLFLIDGAREERPQWCIAAEKLVRPGGFVVFDNANRPEYRDARAYLRMVARHHIFFDTNPPGHKHAVAEMYRMPGGVEWL
jgi:predicted O-methyltransferase YrrM